MLVQRLPRGQRQRNAPHCLEHVQNVLGGCIHAAAAATAAAVHRSGPCIQHPHMHGLPHLRRIGQRQLAHHFQCRLSSHAVAHKHLWRPPAQRLLPHTHHIMCRGRQGVRRVQAGHPG